VVSRDRAAAIVLGCALLGVLGGGAVRTWRGAQVARGGAAQSSPVTAAAGPVLMAPQAVGSSISAVTGGADQGTVKDLGAATAATGDGGTQARAAARAVWVQVLDAQGQAAAGAQVVLRLAFTPSELAGSAPNLLARPPQKDPNAKIGELGVLPGPLPFPEEVVAGTARPAAGPGGAQRGSGEVLLLSGTTDKQGLLRLGPAPSGQVQVMAAAQGLTAQADLVIPPGYQGSEDAGSALRVLLRLAVPTALTGQGLSELSVTTDPDALPLQGTIEEGPEVHGRVVDGRGFAVASARVELVVGRSRTVALTDAAGVFAARGLPRGPLVATVKQQGFAPLQLSQSSEQPRDNLKLVLQPGGGIEGQVRDARLGGVPSGAVLTVETSGSGAQSVTLGSGGHFVVTGLVPGAAVLRARAPGFALLLQTVQVPAGVESGQVTVRDVRLDLVRGATLRGQVRATDGPASGVQLTVQDAAGRVVGRGQADSRGEFVIAELPAGALRVVVDSTRGRASESVETTASTETRVTLDLR